MRTNLAQPQVTKIIKVLENRALIKSVKSVNNPSRKLYMLSELEPSREITGEASYHRWLLLLLCCLHAACDAQQCRGSCCEPGASCLVCSVEREVCRLQAVCVLHVHASLCAARVACADPCVAPRCRRRVVHREPV
jgi:hypothetical protein